MRQSESSPVLVQKTVIGVILGVNGMPQLADNLTAAELGPSQGEFSVLWEDSFLPVELHGSCTAKFGGIR
jgi:hypothetical protein